MLKLIVHYLGSLSWYSFADYVPANYRDIKLGLCSIRPTPATPWICPIYKVSKFANVQFCKCPIGQVSNLVDVQFDHIPKYTMNSRVTKNWKWLAAARVIRVFISLRVDTEISFFPATLDHMV